MIKSPFGNMSLRLGLGGLQINPLLGLINKYGVPGLIFDNQSVFTDAAGTLPAGVGDVVGNESDKSGGGHDITQSVTAAKPILRAGPLLEFDGTDDDLLNTTQPFTGGELTVIWCGNFRAVPSGTHYVFSIADAVSNTDFFGVAGISSNITAVVNNAGSLDSVAGAAFTTDDVVVSCRMNGASSEISRNQARTTKTLTETLNMSTYERFGSGAMVRPSITARSAIDQDYLFVINKELTTAELEQAEQYIANLCGVTL